jgi:hypothetical protein
VSIESTEEADVALLASAVADAVATATRPIAPATDTDVGAVTPAKGLPAFTSAAAAASGVEPNDALMEAAMLGTGKPCAAAKVGVASRATTASDLIVLDIFELHSNSFNFISHQNCFMKKYTPYTKLGHNYNFDTTAITNT